MKILLTLWALTLFVMIGLAILIATDEYNPKVVKVAGITNHLISATCGALVYCRAWKESKK